jgi:hypothetical protein
MPRFHTSAEDEYEHDMSETWYRSTSGGAYIFVYAAPDSMFTDPMTSVPMRANPKSATTTQTSSGSLFPA